MFDEQPRSLPSKFNSSSLLLTAPRLLRPSRGDILADRLIPLVPSRVSFIQTRVYYYVLPLVYSRFIDKTNVFLPHLTSSNAVRLHVTRTQSQDSMIHKNYTFISDIVSTKHTHALQRGYFETVFLGTKKLLNESRLLISCIMYTAAWRTAMQVKSLEYVERF